MVAYPVEGGDPVPVCGDCSDGDGGPSRGRTPPVLMWSPGGQFMYLRFQWAPSDPLVDTGKTYVLRLANSNTLPEVFDGERDVAAMPRVQVIPRWGIFPGPRSSLYAYTREATHRNVYRIPVP